MRMQLTMHLCLRHLLLMLLVDQGQSRHLW